MCHACASRFLSLFSDINLFTQILTAHGRYVGEKIQNESVAIETAGITIVRRSLATAAPRPSLRLTGCNRNAQASRPARHPAL